MEYSFEIVGVSPVLSFFNHQQELQQRHGAAYLGAYRCTLDAFLASVETLPSPPRRNWNLDHVVDAVISFWLNNAEQIQHWKQRLQDAGTQNLLVARVADLDGLRDEFEFLLRQDF